MPHLILQINAISVAEYMSRQSGLTLLVFGSALNIVSCQSLCVLHLEISTEDLSLMWHLFGLSSQHHFSLLKSYCPKL